MQTIRTVRDAPAPRPAGLSWLRGPWATQVPPHPAPISSLTYVIQKQPDSCSMWRTASKDFERFSRGPRKSAALVGLPSRQDAKPRLPRGEGTVLSLGDGCWRLGAAQADRPRGGRSASNSRERERYRVCCTCALRKEPGQRCGPRRWGRSSASQDTQEGELVPFHQESPWAPSAPSPPVTRLITGSPSRSGSWGASAVHRPPAQTRLFPDLLPAPDAGRPEGRGRPAPSQTARADPSHAAGDQ